jgi:hypothetical protein
VTTSSADPDKLEAYSGQLVDADDELTTLAGDLDDAMSAYVAGAGSFASGFDAGWAGGLVRAVRDESRHLSGWVADVGAAFREAGARGLSGDRLDSFISSQVGEPTIYEQGKADEGEAAAEELHDELEALGLDPANFEPSQIAQLDPYDPRYQELYALMAEIGDGMANEDFAVGFYDAMDADGIQTVVTLIDHASVSAATYGHDQFPWNGNVQEQVLAPFVAGWALASGSIDLAGERAGLLATETYEDQQVLARLMSGDPNATTPCGWPTAPSASSSPHPS